MAELTFDLRQRLRQEISMRRMVELGLAKPDGYKGRGQPLFRGQGRCLGCGTPYDQPQTGCGTCRDREKSRRKRTTRPVT